MNMKLNMNLISSPLEQFQIIPLKLAVLQHRPMQHHILPVTALGRVLVTLLPLVVKSLPLLKILWVKLHLRVVHLVVNMVAILVAVLAGVLVAALLVSLVAPALT